MKKQGIRIAYPPRNGKLLPCCACMLQNIFRTIPDKADPRGRAGSFWLSWSRFPGKWVPDAGSIPGMHMHPNDSMHAHRGRITKKEAIGLFFVCLCYTAGISPRHGNG